MCLNGASPGPHGVATINGRLNTQGLAKGAAEFNRPMQHMLKDVSPAKSFEVD